MEGCDQPPYDVRLDAERALELTKAGGSLLLLGVPSTTMLGIDMQMFALGPNFQGVKMLPPGPHFVYYTSSSKHGHDASPVTGLFLHLSTSQVIVRRWDPETETLIRVSDSSEEERFVQGVRNFDFDKHLGAYDIHHFGSWQHLTNYITVDVISRLEPTGGNISILAEAQVAETYLASPAERKLMKQIELQRSAFSSEEHVATASSEVENSQGKGFGRCFYTPLPQLVKRAGLSASELTALNLDKSTALESLLHHHFKDDENLLLGELQFSFVAFLMGQSLESFRQWKELINLMLSCEAAPLHMRTVLFSKFLVVLYWQLKLSLEQNAVGAAAKPNVPFLDSSWFSEDNSLRMRFKDFFLLLLSSRPVDGELLHQARRLQKLLEGTLGWLLYNEASFDSDDEFAPVVVDDGGAMSREAMEM